MENKYLSIAEIAQAKLDQLTSKKNELAAKLKESASQAENRAKENKRRLNASQDKIAAIESLISASRKEGLEPSQQQIDALTSRKQEHAALEKELSVDPTIKVSESLRHEVQLQIQDLEKLESAEAKNLELATQLESEWHGDTFQTLHKGSDIFTDEVSGVPDLLVLPSLDDALRIYFSEMPMSVQSNDDNFVTGVEIKPFPGKCARIVIPILGERKRRILCPYLGSEWIEQANALSKKDHRVLEDHGDGAYRYSKEDRGYTHKPRFQAFENQTKRGHEQLLFIERDYGRNDIDYASHPNRACFFYAEDTGTAYALKPGSIDRCQLIRKESRSASWYPGESHQVLAVFVNRTPSDCSSLFSDFKSAIDAVISTVDKGIDPEKLPQNALGDALAALLENTTAPKIQMTASDARPASEDAYKLIAPYWEALIQAPWGSEIIGTYADIKDLCLSGAKPHAWLDNAAERIGLRFKSKTESWLVAHIYCPLEHQGKSATTKIETKSLRQGSNYKVKGTPGDIPHLVQSGPCFIRILSHPDR